MVAIRRAMIVLWAIPVLVLGVAAPAAAQVPALPDVPEIPEPAAGVVAEVQGAALPLLIEAAKSAQPVTNATGFVLRPGCSAVGTAVVAAALLGGTLPVLPVNPGLVMQPVFIACGAAFDDGPVDPIFLQIDGAIGDQFEEAAQPVLDRTASAVAPLRPSLSEGCSVLTLFGSAPQQVPPPLHRIALLPVVCG